jgi:uncharacterized phiE125 gp8 family phage protein
MSLLRVSPPGPLVVSLAELRAQCNLTDDDGTDQNALLAGYARTAMDWVEQQLGKALTTSVWQYSISTFPYGYAPCIRIPLEPLISVDEITYTDLAGVSQVLPTTRYALLAHGQLLPAYGLTWPATRCPSDVVIRFTAGFGPDHNAIPEPIRQAVMMMAAYFFDQRSAALVDPEVLEVPFGVRDLLAPYRAWAF